MTVPVDDDDPVVAAKNALRSRIRAQRSARPPDARAAADPARAVRLAGIPEVAALVADPSSGCVAAYASYGTEPGTSSLRGLLAVSGVGVLLPVIRADGGLDWAWDSGEVGPGAVSAGIPEPAAEPVGTGAAGLLQLGCRVVLVPALAVDRRGGRLGKGAGFYDRVLAGLEADDDRPLLVAVVHDDDVVDEIPTHGHDMPVDAVLTPSAFLDLRRPQPSPPSA